MLAASSSSACHLWERWGSSACTRPASRRVLAAAQSHTSARWLVRSQAPRRVMWVPPPSFLQGMISNRRHASGLGALDTRRRMAIGQVLVGREQVALAVARPPPLDLEAHAHAHTNADANQRREDQEALGQRVQV